MTIMKLFLTSLGFELVEADCHKGMFQKYGCELDEVPKLNIVD